MCPPGACSERCAGWGFFASFHACERAVLRGLCVKVAQLGLFRGERERRAAFMLKGARRGSGRLAWPGVSPSPYGGGDGLGCALAGYAWMSSRSQER